MMKSDEKGSYDWTGNGYKCDTPTPATEIAIEAARNTNLNFGLTDLKWTGA